MAVYGIRIRKGKEPFRRVRTIKNPKGVWSLVGAKFTLNKLRARGFRGHTFKIEQAVHYPTVTHYSEHFTRFELDCKCGCIAPPEVVRNLTELAVGLEEMRKKIQPLNIISGYRCKERNDAVGGARDSQHMKGTAADLYVPHGLQDSYVEVANSVDMFHDGGIGVYPNGGVHVDHRDYVARWDSWTR